MVDTIHFYLDNVTILVNGNSRFTLVKRSYTNEDDTERKFLSNIVLDGHTSDYNAVYVNSDKYSLDVRVEMDYNSGIPRQFGILKTSNFRMSGNALKILSKINFFSEIENIFNEVRNQGVDFSSIKLSRVDSGVNVETQYSSDFYLSSIRNKKMSRMKTREYVSTLLFHNTVKELTVYDKKIDLKLKHNIDVDGNLLRIEERFLTSNKINSELLKASNMKYDKSSLSLLSLSERISYTSKIQLDEIDDFLSVENNSQSGKFLDIENFDLVISSLISDTMKFSRIKSVVFNAVVLEFGVSRFMDLIQDWDKSLKSRIRKELDKSGELKFSTKESNDLIIELKNKIRQKRIEYDELSN